METLLVVVMMNTKHSPADIYSLRFVQPSTEIARLFPSPPKVSLTYLSHLSFLILAQNMLLLPDTEASDMLPLLPVVLCCNQADSG